MKIKMREIGIFIFCVILGACIAIQTKTTNSEHAFVSAQVIDDNKISMEAEKSEIERLRGLITEANEKLNQYESDNPESFIIESNVDDEYAKSKKTAGCTDVTGPGISILLDDGDRALEEGEDANDIIVHDLDIMIIIDELIKAGAEAISINGERYVSMTEISCSGHTVRINGKTYARPFRIEAIGEPTSLYSAMLVPGSYGDILREYGFVFEVTELKTVEIPAYKYKLDNKYMKSEEE